MKKTLSVDLRERIVAAYDAKEGTREEVGKRFVRGQLKPARAGHFKTGHFEGLHLGRRQSL